MRRARNEAANGAVLNLGRVLRAYRLLSEIEQRELGKAIGIGASTLCRIELGYAPDGFTLTKILDWLMRRPDHE